MKTLATFLKEYGSSIEVTCDNADYSLRYEASFYDKDGTEHFMYYIESSESYFPAAQKAIEKILIKVLGYDKDSLDITSFEGFPCTYKEAFAYHIMVLSILLLP